MSVLGIVAEYNPLHHGHLFHIEQSRRLTGADAVVCVMSGNFTQRGEAAIVDKWARSEMALASGVDLVFELPFVFASRSAYHFARGAVMLLQATGTVTHISFGSEAGSLELLSQIAHDLMVESKNYRDQLKYFLAQGNSFPHARTLALTHITRDKYPGLTEIMSSPNNILAIEYLRVLSEINSSLIPLTITRQGAGYHDQGDQYYASASSIRRQIFKDKSLADIMGLPSSTISILQREFNAGRGPVNYNHLSRILLHTLRSCSPDDLADIYEITEGLENRLLKAAQNASHLEQLVSAIKSKRYNRTRIFRTFLYILMNLTKENIHMFDQAGPLYLRLLAFSPQGQKILHEMKTKSQIPVITKTGGIFLKGTLPPTAQAMLALDFKATDLYSLLWDPIGKKGLDYLRSPVSLPNCH